METESPHKHASRDTGWARLIIGRVPRLIALGLALLLAVALTAAVFDLLETPPANLAEQTMDHLPETGVQNPVTGVLLNYRAYDTWLELGVLLVALMGTFALLRASDLRAFPPTDPPVDVLGRLVGLFVPLMIVVGGYLLWRGTHAPGGAFQAGALWAAAGVVARLAGVDRLHRLPGGLLRGVSVAGFALFLAVGLVTMMPASTFLEYRLDVAGRLIFALELLATVSIALTLWALYIAAYPAVDHRPPPTTERTR